jgi:hypothetical protein
MGLRIQTLASGTTIIDNLEGADTPMWKSDRRLWRTEQGLVVEDGDVNAAFLFATEGDYIPLAVARDLGIVDEGPEEKLAKQEVLNKQAEVARNKQSTVRDQQEAERRELYQRQARQRMDDENSQPAEVERTPVPEPVPEPVAKPAPKTAPKPKPTPRGAHRGR